MDYNDNGTGKETQYDVFISYSHADAEIYGEKLIQSIKEGIEAELSDIVCRPLVFLDSEALGYGDEWHAKIMEKLNECRVFVCLLSENYLASTYCKRERLWWEQKEIRNGRFRRDTLPVYFIRLNTNPFEDPRREVRDLFGFQMLEKAVPWFDVGKEEVKEAYLKSLISNLKEAVDGKLLQARTAGKGFNSVNPPPTQSFVGRILELKELREICASDHYPVIEGGAGAGKSELATVYAYGYAGEYPQGRFLIHMEGKRNWQDAVVSLVKDPDSGRDVQSELGIKDEEVQKDDRSLHRLIVEKLFERAGKGRLLLLLDNVDDASLFEEDRLLDFSLKKGIPANIHMLATTRHQLEFQNKYRAEAYRLGNLDDDASFELFCEIGQNIFPFCRQPIFDKDSDPEYKAVMDIIHLLDGHVWSMEIIAGQMAHKYFNGITFQKKLASLKKNFSLKRKGPSRRSAADNPEDLVRGTLDILKNCENGNVIIYLAYLAAMLAPDGKKKEVLKVCWGKLFSDVTFEDEDEDEDADAFLPAYNHLWRYNLIHGIDDDKMHRLTQVALKQIMKDDGIFEECVGKLADIMAGNLSIPHETWIDTVIATPEIAAYLNNNAPDFLSILFSPKAWVKMLSCDPPHPILIGMCPWDLLNGDNWAELLSAQPQFTDRCPWEKLDGPAWYKLLSKKTLFADKCDWAKLDGYEWGWLLATYPRFSDKCLWNKLNGYAWSWLLAVQPDFSDKCDWDKLDGKDWAQLLKKQPKFANRCPWDKLDGYAWSWLLAVQPDFSDKCDWDKLDGENWSDLLQKQPKLADKCDWNKLSGYQWSRLVRKQPEFIDRCPWDKLGSTAWQRLLEEQPKHADKCDWNKLTGYDWAELLAVKPQFEDQCDWNKLNQNDWAWLVRKQPQFASQCPWDKLDGEQWECLLSEQPQFANRCPWDKLNGKDWQSLLKEQPRFADKCPWDKLDGKDWVELLEEQLQFYDKCHWDKLDDKDWLTLLQKQPQFATICRWDKLSGSKLTSLLIDQPQFADKCQWDKLNGKDWQSLLRKQPQFADKCQWDKLSGNDWAGLLIKQPKFADKCQWNKLDGNDWAGLLGTQPQFADRCPWDELDDQDWESLLIKQPQFADKRSEKDRNGNGSSGDRHQCQWDKMNGLAWSFLLRYHPPLDELDIRAWPSLLRSYPKYADQCPWDKLEGFDWRKLLCYRPEFADRCPWNKLTGEDWADLLRKQPQFADRCPWDKLSDDDWNRLLKSQPQFKDLKS